MGARLLLDLLYKSELVDRDSLLVALLLAELPTEEEIKKTLITYSVNWIKPIPNSCWEITEVITIIIFRNITEKIITVITIYTVISIYTNLLIIKGYKCTPGKWPNIYQQSYDHYFTHIYHWHIWLLCFNTLVWFINPETFKLSAMLQIKFQ